MTLTAKTLEIKVERTIPAPPGEVHDAWLNPAIPGNPWNIADKCILDAKVDGLFYWTFQGTSHYGRFTEIERPAKITHTWMSPNTLGQESMVTLTFQDEGGSTRMTLVHSGLPDTDGGRSHEKGWNYFLDIFPGQFRPATRNADYSISVETDLPPSEAFARINAVPDWWTKGFTGLSRQRGDAFTVRFGDTFVDFQVAEVVPETRIVWQVVNCNLPWQKNREEWTGTRVVWEATRGDGKNRIRMTHVGLVPRAECYEACHAGWNFYLGESLRRLLTEGAGLPDQKPR